MVQKDGELQWKH